MPRRSVPPAVAVLVAVLLAVFVPPAAAAPGAPASPSTPLAAAAPQASTAAPQSATGAASPLSWGLADKSGIPGGIGGSHPTDVPWAFGHVDALSVGESHTCVVAGGKAVCWGRNDDGQLGNNTTSVNTVLTPVVAGGALAQHTVTAVASGAFHSCAIADGAAYCWGSGTSGELGNQLIDAAGTSFVPVPVQGLPGPVSAISVGRQFSCAIAASAVWCWGLNDKGQLGRGATSGRQPVAAPVAGLPAPVTGLDVGDSSSCAISSGVVRCWGEGAWGQLGDGVGNGVNTHVSATPVWVPLTGTAGQVAVGNHHACAVVDGGVRCWGWAANGEIGNGSYATAPNLPVEVGTTGVLAGKRVTSIAAGTFHTCALADGRAYCWGQHNNGQLGDGAQGGSDDSPVPVAVLTSGALAGRWITAIGGGGGFTIAMAEPRTAGAFVAVDPVRVLDATAAANAARSVPIAGVGGLPATGMGSVLLNVVVDGTTAGGSVLVHSSGGTVPTASNLNFVAGERASNLAVSPLGVDGRVVVRNAAGGNSHVVVDVVGWYVAGAATAAGTFTALTPTRLLDTRVHNGVPGTNPVAGTVVLQVRGRGSVPADASAVVVNVTVTQPSPGGHVTVYPAGAATPPTVSNLNFGAGQTLANLVMVPLSSSGTIALSLSGGTTAHLIADVAGYYRAGTPAVTGAFVPVGPTRVLDTRLAPPVVGGVSPPIVGLPRPKPGTRPTTPSPGYPLTGTLAQQFLGVATIPSDGAMAVVLNATVTEPVVTDVLGIAPDGRPPTTVNLQFNAGQTIPRLSVTPTGKFGNVRFSTGIVAPTQLIVDVQGFFRAGPS